MMLKIGVNLMSRGAGGDGPGVKAIGCHAEALGFDYISSNDHIVVPQRRDSRYPYSDDGVWTVTGGGQCLDLLTVLTYLAAVTDTVRLLSSVLVLPHRPPVQTAKTLATIDQLSGGRLTVGCGAGWLEEEFIALSAPDYTQRGKVADEYIQAFRNLWCEAEPAFSGTYVNYSEIMFEPKPIQRPHPPIWIGGESPAALRRAARLGDGWYPASINPQYPLTTPAQMKTGMDRMRAACDEAKRDMASLDLAYVALAPVSARARQMQDGSRHPFTGDVAEIAGDIAAFADLGIETMIFALQKPELQASLDHMSWFAEEVLPLLNR